MLFPRLLLIIVILVAPAVWAGGGFCQSLFVDDGLSFERMAGRGHPTVDAADALANRVNALSAADKKAWIDSLLRRYRGFRKSSTSQFAPRRLADRVLALTLRGDVIIESRLAEGASAREAFATYYDFVAAGLGTGLTHQHAFRVLELVQKILRAGPARGEQDHVLAGGSFFNGKADPRLSDVDVFGSHRDFIFGYAEGKNVLELNRAMREFGINANLEFEFHRIGDPHYLGLNQPVVFKVYRDRIEMLVYSPTLNRYGLLSSAGAQPRVIPLVD